MSQTMTSATPLHQVFNLQHGHFLLFLFYKQTLLQNTKFLFIIKNLLDPRPIFRSDTFDMSASRNAEANAGQPGEFGSHVPRDEPLTTHGV